ncbi:MAG: hypothetical protein RMM58_12815 [Chloroflexota bacterium]|nr:hypothetical protein [Dehalococcoidia bacterium]MDW8254751.1 hypothetical protein [Chloroflexota bacterium]
MAVVDDRVWTVRFRREVADLLRQRAAAEGKTVQQVIIAAVERYFGLEEAGSPAVPREQDLYQYGGGEAVSRPGGRHA